MKTIRIGRHSVGEGQPCFVIAEAGVNHNGDVALAHELVEIAAEAGADAVKFQTFNAERLASDRAPKAEYQVRATGDVESQAEMLKRLELTDQDFRDLAAHCTQRGIVFLSTPFDEEAADFLDTIGVAAFKVPSGEITNTPFLQHIARKGRPMIVSTGMCFISEVETAVHAIESTGARELALLHCTSSYPAEIGTINLRAMATLREAFARPVGYSDHTVGIEVSLAAVALGAVIIEKHFTSDRRLPGPDHLASLEPPELNALVAGIRTVEAALGTSRKAPSRAEIETARVARKSLVAARNLPHGTTLDVSMVVAKRPGDGISPAMLSELIGRRTRRALGRGELIRLTDLED